MREHIRHSNLIEGINDKREDELSMFAWLWLEKQERYNQPVLLELHRLITCKQLPRHQCGKLRTIQVYIGDHTPPNGEIMQAELYGWGLDMLEPEKHDPIDMHIRFEKIHPFVDGNGRVGRMLMWWHEKKLGREPTLIRSNEADRFEYYKLFKGKS